jgi:hybrid cluster-associated redox disulfide protein
MDRMAAPMPTTNMTVAEILDRWPGTVSVFQELKTACVGCTMAQFDTVVDVARIYELDLSDIMAALNQSVNDGEREAGRFEAGDSGI